MRFEDLRIEYRSHPLDPQQMHANPFIQFELWMQEALKKQVIEPNAMALATANLQAQPSCRMVLIKQIDENGLQFFTHYRSRKGVELLENPRAAGTFYWKEMHRQVEVEGRVLQLSEGISEAYFQTRSRGSQLGTLASIQGAKIKSREELEAHWKQLEKEYEGKKIPKPSHWGGFVLIPEQFEFWQGNVNRLHDRFRYREGELGWEMVRLSP